MTLDSGQATEPAAPSSFGSRARTPWGWADIAALLAWTAAVVVVFGEAATLQKALFYFDITEINYPYRDFVARAYRAGEFSRWMPGLYCGLPLFAESQAGFLHPFKLLYLVLPTWRAFNLDTILSVWLTGLAAYGWFRRHAGAAGALTGAVIMGMNGFVWSHLIHTSMSNALVSVPLAFWALECTWDGGRFRGLALGALAIACQIFAGHLQDTILTSLALGLFGLARATQESRRAGRCFVLGTTVGMVALGGLIAAVQVLPSKDLIDRSPRSEHWTWQDITYGSWSPELLPTLLVREAYGTRARDTDWMDGFYPYQEMDVALSLLGLGLAVLGLRSYRDRWVGYWPLLGGIGLLLMLGRFTILFDPMAYIPIIGSGRIPVRYHLWVALAVAALAAIGVDDLTRGRTVRVRGMLIFWLIALTCAIGIMAYAYAPIWTDPGRWPSTYHRHRTQWLATELALATLRSIGLALVGLWLASGACRMGAGRRRSVWVGLLPLLVLADLMGAHWAEVPTIDPSYWTVPPASARLLKADPECARVFGLGYYSAGEPGYASKPVDFFAARDTLAWSLAPVWGLRSSGRITPIVPTRMVRYDEAANDAGVRFDLEGVTHILSGPSGSATRFGTPVKVGSASIYRNKHALPRARLLGRPVYVEGERAAERALRELGTESLERIIVEDPAHPLAADARVEGTAEIVRDDAERVDVETRSSTPAYLFLADSFDPGWSAELDGRPAAIRPANIAFRAVFVPAGTHRVVFRYEPVGFRIGLGISLAGLGAALALLLWRRRVVELQPPHGDSNWPSAWPWWGLAAALLILLASIIAVRPEGGIGIQQRWGTAFHRFTWGAKVEAIQPRRRELD